MYEAVSEIENQEHDDAIGAKKVVPAGVLLDLVNTLNAALAGAGVPVDATITVPPVEVDSAKVGSPDGGTTKVFLKTDASGVVDIGGTATEATLVAIKNFIDSVISSGAVLTADYDVLAEIEKLTAIIADSKLKVSVENFPTDYSKETGGNLDDINTAVTALAAIIVDGKLSTSATVDTTGLALEAGNLADVKTAVEALAALIADSKLPVSTDGIKTTDLNIDVSKNVGVNVENLPTDYAKETGGNLDSIELHTKAVSDIIVDSKLQVSTDAIKPSDLNIDGLNNLGVNVENFPTDYAKESGGNLDDISSSVSVPTSINSGSKTVTTAGTRVALASTTPAKSVIITANPANTGNIYVGSSTVDSTNGIILEAGDTVSIDIDDIAKVYIDSSVNGEGVRFAYTA